eukprot:GSA25T00025451001.1
MQQRHDSNPSPDRATDAHLLPKLNRQVGGNSSTTRRQSTRWTHSMYASDHKDVLAPGQVEDGSSSKKTKQQMRKRRRKKRSNFKLSPRELQVLADLRNELQCHDREEPFMRYRTRDDYLSRAAIGAVPPVVP